MDIFTKSRMTVLLIVLLVVLNALSLCTLWYGYFGGLRGAGRLHKQGQKPEHAEGLLQRQLRLSQQQKDQFTELRQQHFTESRTMQDKLHELKGQIVEEATSESPDAGKLEELAKEIGKEQEMLERSRYQHFLKMQAQCDPGQRKELASVLKEAHSHAGPPGGGQRPGQPGGFSGRDYRRQPGGNGQRQGGFNRYQPEQPQQHFSQGRSPGGAGQQRSMGNHGGGFINRFDQDGDGNVSQEEFDGHEEHFSRCDTNNDGYIDSSEAPQGPPPDRQRSGQYSQQQQQRY